MEGRWYIYKDGRPVGPMTAAEIRDGLRDGAFDPFDLVAREGSNVRVELVEVDEIFANSKIIYGGGSAAAGAPTTLAEELVSGAIPAEGERTKQNDPSADLRMGNGHLALADASIGQERSGGRRERAPHSFHPSYAPGGGSGYIAGGDGGGEPRMRNRREPKSYYVMDGRGRVLGPVSAREIQTLFFKGVLDKSVVVMKNGANARVRVDKFVAVYSQQRGGQAAGGAGRSSPSGAAHPSMRGELQVGGGFSSRQILKAAPLEREKLTLLAYALAGLLVALAAVLAWRSGGSAWLAKARDRAEQVAERIEPPSLSSRVERKPKSKAKVKAKRSRESGGGQAPGSRLERGREAERERIDERTAERARRRLAEERRRALDTQRLAGERKQQRDKERLAELRKQALEKRRLAEQRRKQAEQRDRARLEALRKQREATMAKLTKKTSKPAAKAPPPPSPAPAAKPTPASKPAGGPQVSALADGQQVTRLGPMSFDRAKVEGCEAACAVTFSGAGGSVTVRFFKAVWGPTLLSKSGGVYLSGLVRKSGGSTTIILSNIQ